MKVLRFFVQLILVSSIGCNLSPRDVPKMDHTKVCECSPTMEKDTLGMAMQPSYATVKGALLGTRFKSLEELKSVIQIEYFGNNSNSDSTIPKNASVHVSLCNNGLGVVSILESGISQGDIVAARGGIWGRYDGIWARLHVLWGSPFAVANRKDLERVYILSRWRPEWFGDGDVAFYDLAEISVSNINTEDLAFWNARDSTEKGYLNTFNHITAQAFITSCFSEEVADFIADAHERYSHPEIITGKFTEDQIKDLEEGPVDNYVDVINNEWGQELGKHLKGKYNINRETYWTPELLANYLNDLQSYYSWAFQIGFKPFKTTDEVVIRFSSKINFVMQGCRLKNHS